MKDSLLWKDDVWSPTCTELFQAPGLEVLATEEKTAKSRTEEKTGRGRTRAGVMEQFYHSKVR